MSGSPNWDGYRLMRDSASSCRLNAQHYLWKQACGFNLHARIFAPAHREMKIADIGTGTGIWLIDVKPGTAFCIDGFDKSLEQCPPAELCPEGCSVRQLDILENIPEELENVYDIVNVRLIQGGLKDDPVPALKNMIAMLKPGGYLQWQEINLSSLSVAVARPDLKWSNMKDVLNEIQNFDIGKWTPGLAEVCAENGLLESRTDIYRVPPEISIPFCQTQLLAYAEISRVNMDNSSPDSKGPQFRALIERAYAELNMGVWLDHKLEVTIARKAG